MFQGTEIAKVLVSALASSISISFAAITFLVGEYARRANDPKDKWLPYARGTRVMNYALHFAGVGLFSVGLYIFGVSGALALTFSAVMFAIELTLLIVGIIYLSHTTLERGLYVWR